MKNMIKRKKSKKALDWVFIGEGPEKGVAYRHALEHPEESVLVIEPMAPLYSLPSNMIFTQMDAIKWLELRASESVKNVREDNSFVCVAMAVPTPDIVKHYQRHAEVYQAMIEKLTRGKPLPRDIPNISKNEDRFVGLVKKVLVPGGKFYLTDIEKSKPQLAHYLAIHEFDIEFQQLSEEQIMSSESPQTRNDYQEGHVVYRIIGTKPSQQFLQR